MTTEALDALRAENEALRKRIEMLEAEKVERAESDTARNQHIDKLERVLRELPMLVDIFDVDSKRSVFKNRDLDALIGYPPGAIAAMGPQPVLYKTVHPEDVPRMIAFLNQIRDGMTAPDDRDIDYRYRHGNGSWGWFRSRMRAFDQTDGRMEKVLMVTFDVTAEKHAEFALRDLNAELDGLVAQRTASLERANSELRDEMAERMRLAAEATEKARLIRLLGSPVLRVWQDVLAMPIIGAIDAERAETATNALLDAISTTGARFAIVDLTGAGGMDSATATFLEKLVAAVALLGAEVVLCGIGSNVAQTMIAEGLSLNGTTMKNLRQALRYCIDRSRKK